MSYDEGFSTEAINRVIVVTFRAGSGLTTLLGGTVRAAAINKDSGDIVEGTASIVDATTIQCGWTAGALAKGMWQLQVLATPPGGDATMLTQDIVISTGAAAA